MQCRRRLQLFKFVESHPEAYRPVSKSLLDMWDTPKCHAAALRVQLACRCCLDREKLMTRQEEFRIETENSIIIQTVARVWIAKRRFATRSLDVEWPTASLRNPDGSYALSMRAALTVQRVFKGHDARHRLRCYILSAFILTNVEVEVETRTASTRIQKAWRACW